MGPGDQGSWRDQAAVFIGGIRSLGNGTHEASLRRSLGNLSPGNQGPQETMMPGRLVESTPTCRGGRVPRDLGAKASWEQLAGMPGDVGIGESIHRGALPVPIRHGKSRVKSVGEREWPGREGGPHAKCRGNQRERRGGEEHDVDQSGRCTGGGRRASAPDRCRSFRERGSWLFPSGLATVGLADALFEGLRLEDVAVATAHPGLDLVPREIDSARARTRWVRRRGWARDESSASAACSRC